jgi:tetratricopeptide (TPR) repeat protein
VALEATLAAGDESARIPLGCALQQIADWARAIAVLEPALATAPPRSRVEGTIALGVALARTGERERAAAVLAEALESANGLGSADPLLARACWELGALRRDEALIGRAAERWIACAQPAWALRARAHVAATRGEAAAPALYAEAVAALDLAVGDQPALVEVLLEAATLAGPQARRLRERAIALATATAGPGSPLAIDAWWAHAIAERDPDLLSLARASVAEDPLAEARIVELTATLAGSETEAGLRLRETALELRERALGIDHPSLVPLVAELKASWDALGRARAEGFLRRCRNRAHPASWVYRNLTYSIASLLEVQGRGAEVAALWREFLTRREETCAPGSPEVVEALQIVAMQRARAASSSPARSGRRGSIEPVASDPAAGPGVPPRADARPARPDSADLRRALVAIHEGLRATPDDPVLRAREADLLRDHRAELLGPLEPSMVRWRLGWFERVLLDLRDDPDAAVLRATLAHPSAARLRELRVLVGYLEGDYPAQGSNAATVLAALAERARPALRSLSLIQRVVTTGEGYLWSEGCRHVDPTIWNALPGLLRLHLGGFDLVHAIAHPRLEELVLDDRPICAAGRWDLPALRRVDWDLHGATLGRLADTELDVIEPVWTQPLPQLRELVVRGSFYAGDALRRDELQARLATLDVLQLPASALDDDPIASLRRHTRQLRHLSRLVVPGVDAGDPRLDRLLRELPNLEVPPASETPRLRTV